MLKIGINASFLRKQNTGIGQVTVNFLKKLTEFPISPGRAGNFQFPKNEEVSFVLYLEEDISLELPENFSKKIMLPIYKRDDLIRKIWWEKVLLPREVQNDQCDLFLSLYQSASIFSKIPHLMIVHDIIPKIFPNYLNNSRKRIYQDFIEKAIRKADKIITVSHHSEKDLIKYLNIKAEKISVVYNDVDPIYKKEVSDYDLKRVLKKYKIKKGYIYNGGGFEVRKNTEKVLRAYWHLVVGNTSAKILKIPHLVISGKLVPELAPLAFDGEKLVKELGIENLVHFIGFTQQKDMPALYRNAAMFVYPSLYEGFGLPILEAMSQGTPVITSKKTSLPEVGADSVLYCDASDYKDLAMVMKNILKNDHLKIALSLKGRQRSMKFSWDIFATKTLNIISMMLKEK